MCRSNMNESPKYKVTITVENMSSGNVTVDELITELLIESFQGEINFETESSHEFYEIIRSLGILRAVDVDALVFNTE
jgi:hypothetical protein